MLQFSSFIETSLASKISSFIETSLASKLLNVLSQINGCSDAFLFVQRMIQGMCSDMLLGSREEFVTHIHNLFGNAVYNNSGNREGHHATQSNLIPTGNVHRGQEVLTFWLEPGVLHHLILIGPDGCGKDTLLRSILPSSSSDCVTIQCNRETGPEKIIDIIRWRCRLYSTIRSHIYRPVGFERLVLLIKNPNVSSRDIYGTSILLALLQQLPSYDGFFDEHMVFVTFRMCRLFSHLLRHC
jgi:hypothetical protein